jgi:hypothetical protein
VHPLGGRSSARSCHGALREASPMPGTRRHRCIKKSQPVRDRRPSRRSERTPTQFSQSVRTERRAVRRHQPDRKTKSRRTCADGSSVHRRVPCRGLVVIGKDLASRNRLLACRGGVRTFGAGRVGYRASLACFIGTLAAVPGSVVMLAHHLGRQRAARKSAFNAWWKRKA